MDIAPLLFFADSTQPNSLLYAFQQTGIAGRIIVAILLILNLFSFTVLFSKIWTLSDARKRNEDFLRCYRQGESPLDLFVREERFLGSPLWSLYRSACFELNQTLRFTPENQTKPHALLVPSQMESVRATLERSFGERVLQLESRMSILASAVSGAPFLGLLGTVWGVMNTFSAVAASQGNPNLSQMAPGISAALLTTVFALLVAIPAMFGYNLLVNQIRATIANLENYRAEFLATAERLYVQHQALAAQPVERQSQPQQIASTEAQSKLQKQKQPAEIKQTPSASQASFGLSATGQTQPAADKPSPALNSTLEAAKNQTSKLSTDKQESSSSRHSPLRDKDDVLDDIEQLLADERARQEDKSKNHQGFQPHQAPKPTEPPIKLPNPGV